MQFNSWVFLAFLGLILPLYYVLRLRAQNVLLLVASYVFYGWWDWRFLGLIFISTGVDYAVGLGIRRAGDDERRRKRLLLVSLGTNLGILGFFKYFDFFAESFTDVLSALGFHADPFTLNILLPVGISFYTFQTMAYTIDVYRRRIEPTRDLLTFALYVAFFPQLVAGPIERAGHLIPALSRPRLVDGRKITSGLALIFSGFVRKIAIADYLAGGVTAVFSAPGQASSARLAIGAVGFALQVYGDFSGYTDIARGTARLLGVDLMLNFRQPYFARNIPNLWRRWHISLSTWLRDYVYIPLGGNRKGDFRTYVNIMTTMVLAGLWHGAAWNFVVFGAIHGVFIGVVRAWHLLRGKGLDDPPRPGVTGFLGAAIALTTTFTFWCLALVIFRGGPLENGWNYLVGLFRLSGRIDVATLGSLQRLLIAGAVLLALDLPKVAADRRRRSFCDHPALLRGVFFGAAIVLLLVLGDRVNAPFIYFQF